MPPATPSAEHHVTLNRLATIARLVAGAAHEVNNALQVISGSVELLRSRTDLPESVQTSLARIGDQAVRAGGAMTGVVALSRAQPNATQHVDLREVASRAVAMRRYAIGRADLTVGVEVPDTAQVVQGNGMHLLQAVLNLIENAEQALGRGAGGRIAVQVFEDGDHVSLRVLDDGPGVAAGDAERIFEPFVTSRPRPESTGLGLPVAREIAQAHDGSLVLEPAERGAMFVLRLPRPSISRRA